MKRLLCLLTLACVGALPVEAGVSVSVHIGGGYGGYHGYSGGSYGGHGYYGCATTGYHGYCGYGSYGRYGGIYAPYPYYGYSSYSYGPSYDYSDYSSPTVYAPSSDGPVYPYAPPAPLPVTSQTAPAAAPTTPSAAQTTLATGKIDDFGFIHSPYSTATFKSDKIAPGQVFYDPITGQAFTVTKPEPSATPATGAAPSTTALPVGKLDEFGYVHSPFSTFTFKVQNGNYAQVFRDPFTGQSFAIRPKSSAPAAVPSVAGAVGSAQASD